MAKRQILPLKPSEVAPDLTSLLLDVYPRSPLVIGITTEAIITTSNKIPSTTLTTYTYNFARNTTPFVIPNSGPSSSVILSLTREPSPTPTPPSVQDLPGLTYVMPSSTTAIETTHPALDVNAPPHPTVSSDAYPPITHETLIVALAIGFGLFFVICLVLIYPLILWRAHKRRERLSEIGEVVLQKPLQVNRDSNWNWKLRPVSEASTSPVLQNAVRNGMEVKEGGRKRNSDDDVEMGMVMRVGTWQPGSGSMGEGICKTGLTTVGKTDAKEKEAERTDGVGVKGRSPISEDGELEEMPSPRASNFGGNGWRPL